MSTVQLQTRFLRFIFIIAIVLTSHHVLSQTNMPSSQPVKGPLSEALQKPNDHEIKMALIELYQSMYTSTNQSFSAYITGGLKKRKILVVTPWLVDEECSMPLIKEIIEASWGTNATVVTYTSTDFDKKPRDVLGVKVMVDDFSQQQGKKIMTGSGVLHYELCIGAGFNFEVVFEDGKWKTKRLYESYAE